jgi:hypothetical protein
MCSSPTSHQGTYKKQNDSPLATCTKWPKKHECSLLLHINDPWWTSATSTSTSSQLPAPLLLSNSQTNRRVHVAKQHNIFKIPVSKVQHSMRAQTWIQHNNKVSMRDQHYWVYAQWELNK